MPYKVTPRKLLSLPLPCMEEQSIGEVLLFFIFNSSSYFILHVTFKYSMFSVFVFLCLSSCVHILIFTSIIISKTPYFIYQVSVV